MQPGDVILPMTASRLTAADNCLAWSPIRLPDAVKLSVWREGKEQAVELKLRH